MGPTTSSDGDFYYSHQEKMDLLLLAAYGVPVRATDLMPQELYALQLRCAGEAGQLGLGEFFATWRSWSLCLPHTVGGPKIFASAPSGRPWPLSGRHGCPALAGGVVGRRSKTPDMLGVLHWDVP